MDERHVPMEQLEVYRRYVDISDWVWHSVGSWPALARDTVGRQLVRAIDSVAANLVEGDGRHGSADAIQFFVVARASAREARHWLVRAVARGIVSEDAGRQHIAEIESASKLPNNLIAYRRSVAKGSAVREEPGQYDAYDLSIDDNVTGESE